MRFALTLFLFIAAAFAEPAFVPQPKKAQALRNLGLALTPETKIVIRNTDGRDLMAHAEVLAGEIEMVTGLRPTVEKYAEGNTNGAIFLNLLPLSADKKGLFAYDPEHSEAYRLTSTTDGVVIEAEHPTGIGHGTATLIQAIVEKAGGYRVPGLRINDEPVSGYRGVMIDVARNRHSIGVLEDVIRMARLYKLRYVHLHLTDDQSFTFPFEPVTGKLENNHFYTRGELVDLVAYAEARGIVLIPEFDLPGHSRMLMKANYLNPNVNHADVADPQNYDKITAVIDDMLAVFKTSPCFHIGGDESGAGEKLVPFLAHINEHVRSREKRLLVWEGFHGAPTDVLPATGDDRIVVMAWESSYNTPWTLLESGYEIINSSWAPTYIVGGGAPSHYGNTGGRKWSVDKLYQWDKDTFMHWEPGRPVYEDAGPHDDDQTDSVWEATPMGRNAQILGGQMQFWEQRENVVMQRLPKRLATAAERLWNPTDKSVDDFKSRLAAVAPRVMTIVQPVMVAKPALAMEDAPVEDFWHPYEGDSIALQLVNRSKLKGTIRYELGKFTNQFNWIGFDKIAPVTGSSAAFEKPIEMTGGFGVRAALFREDGSRVGGTTWEYLNNWPNRVRVTDFDTGKHALKEVVDLARMPAEKKVRTFELPMLRGPVQHIKVKGQMIEATFTAPATGEFVVHAKSGSGRAKLYFDANRNGDWNDDPETTIAETVPGQDFKSFKIELKKGQKYPLRVDHMTAMPSPALVIALTGPGYEKPTDISNFLTLPEK